MFSTALKLRRAEERASPQPTRAASFKLLLGGTSPGGISAGRDQACVFFWSSAQDVGPCHSAASSTERHEDTPTPKLWSFILIQCLQRSWPSVMWQFV